jgi:NADPH:quinone reductase-like Zn-dependent oxidoreductase
MRSIRCEAFGELAGALTLIDCERPVPGMGEVLTRLKADSINPAGKSAGKSAGGMIAAA